MSNNPLFSIIVPTYNRAHLLDRCLKSLTQQTFNEFEVLVCDDGSTDNSKDVVEQYKSKLDITYIWDENWGGPARPRNIGIQVAKGDWICFLDSDDFWYPQKLELCIPFIQKYDIIHHNLDIYTNKETLKKVRGRKFSQNVFQDLLINGNGIITSSVIIRKEIIEKVNGFKEDKNLVAVEDYECWIRVSQITNKFFHLSKSLGGYHLGDGISKPSENFISSLLYLHNNYSKLLDESSRIKSIGNYSYLMGWQKEHLLNFDEAIKFYMRALNSGSLRVKIKTFLRILLCLKNKSIRRK